MVQHKAIHFICNLKSRESISAAADKLKINTLQERLKGNRHSLLLRILSKENNHQPLANSDTNEIEAIFAFISRVSLGHHLSHAGWGLQQILSVGSCKHNGRWGIIFEGAFKTVFHLLYGICESVYGGVDNSELIIIIIICYNPQLLVISLDKPKLH